MRRTHDARGPGVAPVAAPLLLRLLVSVWFGAIPHYKLRQMVHLWIDRTK
jgi:hypothetical protein